MCDICRFVGLTGDYCSLGTWRVGLHIASLPGPEPSSQGGGAGGKRGPPGLTGMGSGRGWTAFTLATHLSSFGVCCHLLTSSLLVKQGPCLTHSQPQRLFLRVWWVEGPGGKSVGPELWLGCSALLRTGCGALYKPAPSKLSALTHLPPPCPHPSTCLPLSG